MKRNRKKEKKAKKQRQVKGLLFLCLLLFAISVVALLVLNAGAAFVINRASVLKKKYWYIVTLVCFVILFFVGRVF